MFSWITDFLNTSGYFGVALLMLLENVFPPIPSELVMPFAGYAAQQGDMDIFLVILSGSFGSLLGALFWYYVGRWLGLERLRRFSARHGRWLTLSPREVDKADAWFDRHGQWAVLFGRLIPAVRTLISVPAGVSGMSHRRFLIASSIGTIVWTAFLALAGYFLAGQYETVQTWLNPVSNVVIGAILAWYLYRVATFGKEVEKANRASGRQGGTGQGGAGQPPPERRSPAEEGGPGS